MADTLESLEIEVKHNSSGAEKEISKVTDAIESMAKALGNALPQLKEYADTLAKVGGAIRSGTSGGKKSKGSLSDDLRESIRDAGRYEIALNKVKEAQTAFGKAALNGDESAAWRAREKELNAEVQLKKYDTSHPLSTTAQELIETADASKVLEEKLIRLEDQLQEAFANGDRDKAFAIRGQILSTEKALERLNKTSKEATNGVKELSKEATKSQSALSKLGKSIARIAFYRAIRSAIKAVTKAFDEGLKAAYAFSSGIEGEGHRFAAAMDSMKTAGGQMKGQLGSAFISLLAAIEPIVVRIINLVTALADAISQIFAAFTGTTYLKSVKTPQKWADAAGGAAKAAKEWKNQLMGFDEINRLNEPNQGGGGGGGNNPLKGYNFEDSPLSDWAMKIRENLALIELAASSFVLALGLILLFSGANIPLGLGLIALGVAGMVHALKEDWGSVDAKIAKAVADVSAVVGGALLAVGALLTFTGANVPLGIGLMLAGVVGIATAVAINWKAIPTTVGSVISEILMVVGGALLALGIVIMFATPSFSPLGLGLIVAGAASLAAGVAINWNNMPQSIGDVVSRILVILGGALVVLGAILCLTGAGIPLGIGLIMAGAASFAGAYAINSGAIVGAVQEACDHIWGIVTGLFQGIHNWIQDILNGISSFLRLSAGANSGSSQFGGWAADVRSVTQRAGGGFVPDGQLFLANEGSAPELVGRIGNSTAVANSDQIIEGIRIGVYDAVSAAMNNGNNDVNVRVYLDSREIRTGQNRINRAMGVG